MNRKLRPVLNAAAIALFTFALASGEAGAATSLPWSSTILNCADWTQNSTNLYNVGCDGLTGSGANSCTDSNGSYSDQITAAANNLAGGGGKGHRFWQGDGKDNNSGGLKIEWTTPQRELWVRWSMRYQAGFKWSGLYYDKWLYFDMGTSCAVVPEWYGSDKVNIWSSCYGNIPSADGNGWNTIMGGTASDGKFHTYMVYLKMDTNGSNGVAEMWVDGAQKISASNVNFGGTSKQGWTFFIIGSNQNAPLNGACMAVDFDDWYVGATKPDSLSPASPIGLQAN